MQQQALIFQKATSNNLASKDEYDIFAGVSSPLNSPFNLYFRLVDLSNSQFVYFYAYSIGKQKAIIWGVYDTLAHEFLIDSACHYDLKILNLAMITWKEGGYQIISSEASNKYTLRIFLFSVFKNDKDTVIKEYALFKTYYVYNAMSKGLIHLDDISDLQLKKNIESLMSEIENDPNRNPFDEFDQLISTLLYRSSQLSTYLENKEDQKKDIYLDLIDGVKSKKAQIFINIFLFLMNLIEMEEYRVAKYIVKLETDKNNENLRKYIDGSFLLLFLYDLSKAISEETGIPLKILVLKLANDLINIYEPHVNVANPTNISNLNQELIYKVHKMSDEFISFLEKSHYSKDSFVNALPTCHNSSECRNDNECGLYQHGNVIPSRYDYT